MHINAINNISFQSLKYHKNGGVKLFDSFYHSVYDKDTPALLATVNVSDDFVYTTKFYNDEDEKTVAGSIWEFFPSQRQMYVRSMYSEEDKRGLGLGAALHLLNIIEMLENPDVDKIILTSTASAMPFHMKFGFYPRGDYYWKLKSNLRIISQEKDPNLRKYAVRAKKILLTPQNNDVKSAEANRLLFEYTRAALSQHKDMEGFYTICMPLILTKNMVLKNRDFYNKLFKKYEIDYQIEDNKQK